jgi:hypothetical protein
MVGRVRGQGGDPCGTIVEGERVLDPALNAEFLLNVFDAVQHILKFAPVYHFIAQGVDVGLDSSQPGIEYIGVNRNGIQLSCNLFSTSS